MHNRNNNGDMKIFILTKEKVQANKPFLSYIDKKKKENISTISTLFFIE